jgi:RHS repeat-associated protein
VSRASAFTYDSLGQLTGSQPSSPDSVTLVPTSYEYDPAGHLTAITADSVTTSFSIDALGRQASQTIGSNPTTTLAYLGTSNTVSSTAVSGSLSAYSAIDAIGDRVTTGLSGAFGYLVPDLHGNVVAAASSGSSPGYLSAYRYDAYGETVASWTAESGSVSVPYRYQGRRLENDPAATDLYDFGARSYDPDLGAFTSFDTVSGSAQNPLSLNRYLYALANPATLTDPDGHRACSYNANTHQLEGADCTSSEAAYSGWTEEQAKRWQQREFVVAARRDKLIALNESIHDPVLRHGVGGVRRCDGPLDCAGDFAAGFANGVVNTPGRYINAAADAVQCVSDTFSKGCLTAQGVVDSLNHSMNLNTLMADNAELGIDTLDKMSQGDFYHAGTQSGEKAADAAVAAALTYIGIEGLPKRRGLKIPGLGKAAGGVPEDALAAAKAKYPKLAEVDQEHHVWPKYLGGPADGPTVSLNGAYHQMITNAFRKLWPYGSGTLPSPEQLADIMRSVYSEFPLPGS